MRRILSIPAASHQLSLTTKNQTGDTVLTHLPDGVPVMNEYVRQALDQARAAGTDVTGAGFTPKTVTLSEGGA